MVSYQKMTTLLSLDSLQNLVVLMTTMLLLNYRERNLGLNKSKDLEGMRKFDVDLKFGKQWEKHIDDVFSGATKCEVKTERDKWASTGNICIEIESYGKPSGLTSTEAGVWVHNLVKNNELCCSLMFNTNKLRKVMEEMKPFTVMGGDNNASKLYLVSIEKLMKAITTPS